MFIKTTQLNASYDLSSSRSRGTFALQKRLTHIRLDSTKSDKETTMLVHVTNHFTWTQFLKDYESVIARELVKKSNKLNFQNKGFLKKAVNQIRKNNYIFLLVRKCVSCNKFDNLIQCLKCAKILKCNS